MRWFSKLFVKLVNVSFCNLIFVLFCGLTLCTESHTVIHNNNNNACKHGTKIELDKFVPDNL